MRSMRSPTSNSALLAGVLEHGDHDPVEAGGDPLDDVEVAQVDRVEAAGDDGGDAHVGSRRVARCRVVSP
jgi:hypothetical protein